MQLDLDKLTKRLSNLDEKIQEVDERLKEARIEIHNLVWDLIEWRRRTTRKNASTKL